ncbi:MAG: serine/threonine protein kinase [Planctomycetes bacterium]|nr:serine/threonine protein kinase [Planctomycetota bacterium]
MPGLIKIGDILGKYEIVGEIGRGSTSFVYRGRHRKLLFPVAVKVIEPSALVNTPGLLDQLKTEAILLAQMNHPNVVRLWDLEDEGPICYLVLEYVPGGTLEDLIRQKGAIPIPYAFSIIRQAAEGLAEAHKYGIVHRDVKPGNLLLGLDGHAKVGDLGLAMINSEEKKRQGKANEQKYVPTGTAAYLAPEQAIDPNSADFRADIYALGATFYHALTGNLPFQGRSSMEVIMKHLRLTPTSPREYVPELSIPGAEVILRMMAKDPQNRFASYDELRIALADVIGEQRAPHPLTETFFDFALPSME